MPQRTIGRIEFGTLKGAERYTDATEGILFPARRRFLLGQVAIAFVMAAAVCFLAFGLRLGLSSPRGWLAPVGVSGDVLITS